ncbi:MAG: hypothetical protein WBN88_09070 [Anderseniella sp.]
MKPAEMRTDISKCNSIHLEAAIDYLNRGWYVVPTGERANPPAKGQENHTTIDVFTQSGPIREVGKMIAYSRDAPFWAHSHCLFVCLTQILEFYLRQMSFRVGALWRLGLTAVISRISNWLSKIEREKIAN